MLRTMIEWTLGYKTTKDAVFSEDRKYRYALKRLPIPSKGFVCFVGLNPSTADEIVDDPTIRKCIKYSLSWGYGGIIMVNLFAFKSKAPLNLYDEEDPIGILNDNFIREASNRACRTIAAWGNHGKHMSRGNQVLAILKEPFCFGYTKAGEPKHPLYLPDDLKPKPYMEVLNETEPPNKNQT